MCVCVCVCVCWGGLTIIKIKNQQILGLKVNPGDKEVSAFDKLSPLQTRDCKKKKRLSYKLKRYKLELCSCECRPGRFHKVYDCE